MEERTELTCAANMRQSTYSRGNGSLRCNVSVCVGVGGWRGAATFFCFSQGVPSLERDHPPLLHLFAGILSCPRGADGSAWNRVDCPYTCGNPVSRHAFHLSEGSSAEKHDYNTT